MKLVYLANNRIPSEKANSLQIMQMCAAFQRQGAEVTLVVPHRVQPKAMRSVGDPFQYYGLSARFPIDWLPCLDALETAPGPLQHPAFALQAATFTLSAVAHLANHPADLYYSRDPLFTTVMAAAPRGIRLRTAFEAHTFPKPGPRRVLHLWGTHRVGHLVCITRGLADAYAARGIPAERILVAPDAVDLERFRSLPDRSGARRQLGISQDVGVVVYAGHLYRWKGAYTLALATRHLPAGCLIYVVGGTEEDLAAFRRFLDAEGLERVRAPGHVPPDRVPAYLAAADVLALPNSARTEASALYTSPMKLFEYMAARRPIVASRLPALQEVLRDGETALLVEPDDPESLARGVEKLLVCRDLAHRLAETAWEEVQSRSWDARARAILGFLHL